MRLLQSDDPHQKLFDHYAAALALLSDAATDDDELPLRQFELVLLEELGYGFDLASDGLSNAPLQADAWYHYQEEYGLVLAQDAMRERLPSYRGADLLQLSGGDFSGAARLCAKRLMRQVLTTHLGDKPLNSRELFRRGD